MRAVRSLIPMVLALALLGCSGPEEPKRFREVAGVRLLMESVVDPAADGIWGSVKTIMTAQGTEEIRPQSEEEWNAVRNSAVTLAESGNLLMIGKRARDDGDWIGWARDLTFAGEQAIAAAEARDADRLFDVGAEIYEVCLGCHDRYWETAFEPSDESAFVRQTSGE